MAVGLAVNGVATVGFLAVASRALSGEDYAAVSALWTLLFAVGNGIMQPLEQEVARAVSARRVEGIGAGPVIRRAAIIGLGFTTFVCLLAVALHGLVLDALLDGNPWLEAGFVIGLYGFAVAHLARGTLSSHGRFHSYAIFFGSEGLIRLCWAGALAVAGVAVVGTWGLLMGLTPFAAVAVALVRQRGLLTPGPQAEWRELTRALGWLLLGGISLSFLLQIGTLTVKLLEPDTADAGKFLNSLQIARIPLFLFQAVLASLLPRLSRLAASGELEAFSATLRRLVVTILGLGVVAAVLAGLVGPWLTALLFTADLALGARDLVLLTLASIIAMAAICMDQALIALRGHSRMAIGWMIALMTFVVVTSLGDDLFLRVELGMLAASVVAFFWMAFWLLERLRHHAQAREVTLAEAAAEAPIQ